jgi:hypothetical protein
MEEEWRRIKKIPHASVTYESFEKKPNHSRRQREKISKLCDSAVTSEEE